MLKRENRLSKVAKKSNASFFNSAFFNIRISDNKEKESRFGIVVSKKTSKKAVLRNKTKRIIRNIITDNLDKLSKSKDIIIVSKKILNKTIKKEAQIEMLDLFQKAKIIK
nr:ribonuclease P protein component [Candidatus Levybacteria bacterium]